ncbi:hypothetical protein pb186bvf_013472 [Paramecium bursaria]
MIIYQNNFKDQKLSMRRKIKILLNMIYIIFLKYYNFYFFPNIINSQNILFLSKQNNRIDKIQKYYQNQKADGHN